MDSTQTSQPGLSGSLNAHLVPGFFFFAIGSFFLGLSFVRCRALAKQQSGKIGSDKKDIISSKHAKGRIGGIMMLFCNAYIPERNFKILNHTGSVLMCLSMIGIIFEGVGGILTRENSTFFSNSENQTLYALLFFVGFAAKYESNHIFPCETMRWAVVLAELGCYLLWNENALQKKNDLDVHVHAIMAQICLLSCISFIWSISSPQNFVAYLTSLCTISLQGTWLITLGINVNHRMSQDHIGVFLVLQILTYTFVVMMGGLYCANLQRAVHLQDYGRYTSLPVKARSNKNNCGSKFVIDDNPEIESSSGLT